ncbi:MAG: bifunctional nuclease family protein [Bacteroidota bacterium]|nr:bifunctional nuclease family protein [Bacteroidota bacterium]
MGTIKLEILGLSSSQSQTGSFALILGEEGGNRRLPIIIGMFEAQAIAIEIEKIVPNRPMTHDLFRSFADMFDFVIDSITISDLKEGVFYAKINCKKDGKSQELDARPSDAIAIGLRFGAPIYTTETIMSEAGIVLSEYDEPASGTSKPKKKAEKAVSKATVSTSKTDAMKDMSAEQLKTLLDEALKNEDYERAAQIRDELNKRN